MKIDYSLITRRTFLNTLFGGWVGAFLVGNLYALYRFAFPTLGKEPDFVILKPEDYASMEPNSTKPFAWGEPSRGSSFLARPKTLTLYFLLLSLAFFLTIFILLALNVPIFIS